MTFICTDSIHYGFGVGNSLDAAYENYTYNGGEDYGDDLTFYEATEIEVEFKVIKKETITKKGK